MTRILLGPRESQGRFKVQHTIQNLMLHAGIHNYRWKANEQLCAISLADMLGENGKAWPTAAYLAEHLGKSEKTIRDSLKVLCEGASDGRKLPVIFDRRSRGRRGPNGEHPGYEYFPSDFVKTLHWKARQDRIEKKKVAMDGGMA